MVTFTCIFVSCTLIFTALSSLLLTVSLLSDEWEFVSYDETKVKAIARKCNHTLGRFGDNLMKLELGTSNHSEDNIVVYLVPAHGGVNSLCAIISEEDRARVKEDGFALKPCISYLSHENILSVDAWLDRMRNLAMSCSIVCLILLGCSAPLGILGLFKKQISTIMVTGVMYILAAVFGIFTLAFMYFKRNKQEGYFTNTVLDRNVPDDYLRARQFTIGWPSSMGWSGMGLCLLSSFLWLLLAKIMRFQVLSPT